MRAVIIEKKQYWIKYTLLFLLLCPLVFLPFILEGKGFIWNGANSSGDGASQYYPYLCYMGQWLKETLAGFFHGDFQPKLYDFSIGMGMDVRTIIRFHPLELLSVLVPEQYMEFFYSFLVILRLYLAGLSFSFFCFYWKKEETAVLAGSVIYVFCGYSLKLGTEHPFFTTPMILLPLILLGAEEVLRGKRILFFTFITGLGFISNYYFMYMCSFAMAGYVLLRFFDLYRENRIRQFFTAFFRLAGGYILGAGLSAAVVLPVLFQLFSSVRVGSGNAGGSLLLYDDAGRYINWFFDLISPYRGTGANTNLNYAVLVMPALVFLFAGRLRSRRMLKAAVIVQAAVLLIPLGGYLLGGFSNVNNRWVFVLSFTLSFVCTAVYGELGSWSRRQALAFVLVTLAFGVVCVYRIFVGKEDIYQLAAFQQLLLCGLLLWQMQRRKVSEVLRGRVLLTVVCLSVIAGGWFTYWEPLGGLTGEFLENRKVEELYEDSPLKRLVGLENDFGRTDTSVISSGIENTAIMLGYPGIAIYNSTLNGAQLEYMMDTENAGLNSILRLHSMDGRTVPEALAHTGYYLAKRGQTQGIPYGFALDEALSDEEYQVYRNEYLLPLGFTYDTVMSREDYESHSPLEKQQMMLEAAVVEDAGGAEKLGLQRLQQYQGDIVIQQLALPREGENLSAVDGGYQTEKGGGCISFQIERLEGQECYLYLEGLEWEKDYSTVEVITSGMKKKIALRSEDGNYSLGRKDFWINLGLDKVLGTDTLTLRFPKKGYYKLKSVALYYVPMAPYRDQILTLGDEALLETQIQKNEVSGKAELSEPKLMVFSIPWDRGWEAWVDGEKQELIRANSMYLGLYLQPGSHELVLRYETPGLKLGIDITLLSGLVFAVLLWYGRKQKGKV